MICSRYSAQKRLTATRHRHERDKCHTSLLQRRVDQSFSVICTFALAAYVADSTGLSQAAAWLFLVALLVAPVFCYSVCRLHQLEAKHFA